MKIHEEAYTQLEVEAIAKHYNVKSYGYDPIKHEVNMGDITMDMDRDTITALANDLKVIKDSEAIIKRSSDLAMYLTNLAKSTIAGKELDSTQQERYEAKRVAALAGDVTYFVDEAELTGVLPADLLATVLPLATSWRTTLDSYLGKIDAIRVKINQVATTDLDLANHLAHTIQVEGLLFNDSTLVVYINNIIDAYTLSKTV